MAVMATAMGSKIRRASPVGDFLGPTRNRRFLCLFVAKLWWMVPRVGKSASEIPMETQLLLLEAGEESVIGATDHDDHDDGRHETTIEPHNNNKLYVLVLPALDGAFRTTLQGTSSNELQFCYESGLVSDNSRLRVMLL
ncbi:hypothetical protein OROHE_008602 [Orobanche hederae]